MKRSDRGLQRERRLDDLARRKRSCAAIVRADSMSMATSVSSRLRESPEIIRRSLAISLTMLASTFTAGRDLLSYGPDPADNYRSAATYVGRILKAAKPAALPVAQPTKYELMVNLKTAKDTPYCDSAVGVAACRRGN